MTTSTMWIRNNMLFYEHYERQLTETELKVQESLQKLSIPDWYLNRRSNPPKILKNFSTESRVPYWKNFNNVTLNSTSSIKSVAGTNVKAEPQQDTKDTRNTGTYKVSQHQGSSKEKTVKSSPKEEKLLDTWLPEVKLRKDISKTFPKVSPSRRIQNINIVLAPGPPIQLSSELEDEVDATTYKNNTFKLKKQEKKPADDSSVNSINQTEKTCECEGPPQKPPRKDKNDDLRASEITNMPRTPNMKGNFKVRASSTPKFMPPASLFSSTIIEETPKAKKVPSRKILEKLSIFEDSSRSSVSDKSFEGTSKPRKLSQSLSEKTSIFENSWKREQLSVSYDGSPKTKSWQNTFLEKNIRSIDPILFETDKSTQANAATSKVSSVVRQIVKMVETSGSQNTFTSVKRSIQNWRNKIISEEKKSNLEPKAHVQQNVNTGVKSPLSGSQEKKSPLSSSQEKKSPVWSLQEMKNSLLSLQEKRSTLLSLHEKKNTLADLQEEKNPFLGWQQKKDDDKQSPLLGFQEKSDTVSPSTRFLTSRRKSIELENVVRSKQPPREKNVVREIIEALADKVNKSSLPRQNKVAKVNQNYVRTMVNSLEKGKKKFLLERPNLRNEEDFGSCSESEAKSCATSASPKDTDSSSDTDQRSPRGSEDSSRTFDYDTLTSSKISGTSRQDDDSVYWIPVSRCKLPRTSSLLSMMSKLSNAESPCVSPIRSDSDMDNSRITWGATFKKTNGLAKKLFRIDETTVIDSGYSDRSDRSVIGCSMTESTLSEDTQNESGSETTIGKVRRSLRRRSIIGTTFRIQC